MSANLEKATLLFERNRFREAEEELRFAVAQEPEDGYAHALLAITLSRQGRHLEAVEMARIARGLTPDDSYCSFAHALVLNEMDKLVEARQAILDAIRMNPYDARYYRVLSQTYAEEHNWSDALSAAEEGLRIDPQSIGCANLRAIALVQLGRKGEAGATISSALERDPSNPYSHANQGWTLLHQNKPQEAMAHFGEALRLEPNMQWAQAGIVEAMKARNYIYRVMLSYFLWMSRLSTRARWGIILGAFFGYRFVTTLSETSPTLASILQPLIYLYLLFVYLTWTSPTLFDLFLRFNKFGRLALPRRKIVASNWVALCLGAAVFSLATAYIVSDIFISDSLINAAIRFMFLVIPVAYTFRLNNEQHFKISGLYTIALTVFVLLELFVRFMSGQASIFGALFWLGIVAYVWLANLVLK